jgi:hypothetical protein
MADRPSDPFAPADQADSKPLELADRTAPPNRPESDPADVLNALQAKVSASARKPVAYKRPDGGAGTYILWGLALLGLGVVVMFGARSLRGSVEGRAAAAKPVPAAAPAAPPVHWTSVTDGSRVLVTVDVQPRSAARLLLDGAPMPSNPVSLPLGSKHTISAFAEGFAAADVDVTADAAKVVRLQLHRSGR